MLGGACASLRVSERRVPGALGAASDLVRNLGGRRYTSIADLEFAARLSRRANATEGVSVRYARDIRVDDLKESNVILLGALHSNPWVELFEKEATLRLEHDERTSAFTVRNMGPGPGEPAAIEYVRGSYGIKSTES